MDVVGLGSDDEATFFWVMNLEAELSVRMDEGYPYLQFQIHLPFLPLDLNGKAQHLTRIGMIHTSIFPLEYSYLNCGPALKTYAKPTEQRPLFLRIMKNK